MKIEINQKQSLIAINLPRVRRLMRHLMQAVAQINPSRRWKDLSLVLLDDAGIVPVNRLYLEQDCVTDVISFAYPQGGRADVWQGEIFVNVERALQLGRTTAGIAGELGLYLAHGADHLAGFGDYTVTDRKAMRRRELRWLKSARDAGLLDGLLQFAS